MENLSQSMSQLELKSDEIFSDAVLICSKVLKQMDLIQDKLSRNVSKNVVKIGHDMAILLIQYFEELEPVEEAELYLENEIIDDPDHDWLEVAESNNLDGQSESPQESSSATSSQSLSQATGNREASQGLSYSSSTESETPPLRPTRANLEAFKEYEPEQKKFKFIPLDEKIRMVAIYDKHPDWSLETLQKNGCAALTRKDTLKRWKEDIEKKGTKFDRSDYIRNKTYERFVEAREKRIPVNIRNLQEFAMQAALEFNPNEKEFSASKSWIDEFKEEFRIKQRKITRFLKPTEIKSMEVLKETAMKFQDESAVQIVAYPKERVLNGDQMGVQYRVDVERTLEHIGKKQVDAYIGDLNKVTHSYTVQYTITASGKLLDTVFICLQEPNGSFGPRISEEIETLSREFQNIFVTCSKSGKLSSFLYQLYLSKVVAPYVHGENFLLLVDSWGGQKNPELYTEFVNEQGEQTCNVKTIPPGCTSVAQPLDVYFHRQSKLLIKEIYNATYLIQREEQITSRRDILKLQSLVHHQLSAPEFKEMIQYAWYKCRMIPERAVYLNVKQICFPKKNAATKCQCSEPRFIKCSWCKKNLCFACFFVDYHPKICREYQRYKRSQEPRPNT